VELTDGDHFLFSCHNDLYKDYISTNTDDITDLCAEITALRQTSPPTDNIAFNFYAADNLATIYVLDPYYNFNITRSMSFENINFNGLHALATLADTTTIPTHPPLATIPVKKCDITEVEECSAFADNSCSASGEPTAETWGTN